MPDFNAFSESFFSDRHQEEEPMDWKDVPFLPEVSAPFIPPRPPQKMGSLISVQTEGGVLLHSRGCPQQSLKPRGTKVADLQVVFLGYVVRRTDDSG
ncbi:hypothetical protein TNCT_516331 [Trichonephila clavata]|uniref:Uncharacterized protein n=1 Tax=Trichonephila clavata TaxID=2740835 RepID=A0A8X6FKI0_TRICU|nr:hypothetical protein TNCT_516331 [Trichonephila clavata]